MGKRSRNHSPASEIQPPRSLEDAVVDVLLDLKTESSEEIYFMALPAECTMPNCQPKLCLLIDTSSGSVGFLDDLTGTTWLIWQVHPEGRAGAIRCAANENPNILARFCHEILLGACIGSGGAPVCH